MSTRPFLFSLLFAALPAALPGQEISALIKLKVAVEEAHEKPREQATLKALFDARHALKEERAHAEMLAVVALGLRLQSQKEASDRVTGELKKKFPKSGAIGHLDNKRLLGLCPTCQGSARARVECTKCEGTGKCQNSKCKGGYVTILGLDKDKTKRCPSCKRGRCGECEGYETVKRDCLRCGKTGKIVTKDKIERVYKEALWGLGRRIERQMEDIVYREKRAAERAQASAPKPPPQPTAATKPPPTDEEEEADPFANITLEQGDSEYDAVFADHRTSAEVEEIAKNIAMWINFEQRKIKAQPVRRLYAVVEGDTATLHVETGDDFTAQTADWRGRFLKDCDGYWAKRCRKNKSGQSFNAAVKYLAPNGEPLTATDPQK